MIDPGRQGRLDLIATLAAAGFKVTTESDRARHCRISVPGAGWVDYWPGAGRWKQSRRRGGAAGAEGEGLPGLMEKLQEMRG